MEGYNVTDTQLLDVLKRSRDILDANYVKWFMSDGSGGHCARGSVLAAMGIHIFLEPWDAAFPCLDVLDQHAKALHPELVGHIAEREFGMWLDRFDEYPLPYINNQLGKAATLAVFDSAILEVELRLAQQPEAQPEPVEALSAR